jgi:hypothetical protein
MKPKVYALIVAIEEYYSFETENEKPTRVTDANINALKLAKLLVDGKYADVSNIYIRAYFQPESLKSDTYKTFYEEFNSRIEDLNYSNIRENLLRIYKNLEEETDDYIFIVFWQGHGFRSSYIIDPSTNINSDNDRFLLLDYPNSGQHYNIKVEDLRQSLYTAKGRGAVFLIIDACATPASETIDWHTKKQVFHSFPADGHNDCINENFLTLLSTAHGYTASSDKFFPSLLGLLPKFLSKIQKSISGRVSQKTLEPIARCLSEEINKQMIDQECVLVVGPVKLQNGSYDTEQIRKYLEYPENSSSEDYRFEVSNEEFEAIKNNLQTYNASIATLNATAPDRLKMLDNASDLVYMIIFLDLYKLQEIKQDFSLSPVWDFIHPIYRLATISGNTRELTKEILERFFDSICFSPTWAEINYSSKGMRKIISKILLHCLYEQPELLKGEKVEMMISGLMKTQKDRDYEGWWSLFFVDFYLRAKFSSRATIDFYSKLFEDLKNFSTTYINSKRFSPLAKSWEFLDDPLIAYNKIQPFKITSLKKEFLEIAELCLDYIECKWCFIAFQKVLPLFRSDIKIDLKIPEEHLSTTIEILTKLFKEDVEEDSKPSVWFILLRLKQYLKLFIELLGAGNEIKLKECLKKYEQIFYKYAGRLPDDMKAQVQLEYACCIYKIAERESVMGSLMFSELKGTESKWSTHILFKNSRFPEDRLLGILKESNPDKFRKKKLGKYIDWFWKNYVKGQVSKNPLVLLDYPGLRICLDHLKETKQDISSSLKNSLIENRLKPIGKSSGFYASAMYLIFVMLRDSNKETLSLTRDYLEQAIQYVVSDRNIYDFRRSFREILWAMHRCYYYDSDYALDYKIDIEEWLTKIECVRRSNQTIFSDETNQSWVYDFGIRLNLSLNATENFEDYWSFIEDLAEKISIPSETSDFKVWSDDSTQECICLYRQEISLAQFLEYHISSSEVWNILATSIVRSSKYRKTERRFDIEAKFYRMALACFDRAAKENSDQARGNSYFYANYIHARSLQLFSENGGRVNLDDFFSSTYEKILFGKMIESKNFEDRYLIYFLALAKFWSDIDESTKRKIKASINKIKSTRDKRIRDNIDLVLRAGKQYFIGILQDKQEEQTCKILQDAKDLSFPLGETFFAGDFE